MAGGSKKTTTPATPAAQAQAAMSVPTTTFGAFIPPEQQGLLAAQLAAGGFGTPDAISGLLGNFNKPVTMPLISTPDQIAGYLKQIGKETNSNTAGSSSGNKYGQIFRNEAGDIIDGKSIKRGQNVYMNGLPMKKV